MNPLSLIKRIYAWIFPIPTKLALAVAELQEAELELMASQTGKEWATAKMTYNDARILRLRRIINDETKAKKKENGNEQWPKDAP